MGAPCKYSDADIIAALKKYAGILGEPPGMKQMYKDSRHFDWLPNPQTVVYHFGSWTAAFEAANLPVKTAGGYISLREPPPSILVPYDGGVA